ncbi:MAG: septum formation initiator family protein [Desulfobacterales bacterium]|nr:septum formation initiator family protein [Desulfobacterales bacterium]MDD3951199.1 septum formation initiator family protein [Desulfobacterales bacterium]
MSVRQKIVLVFVVLGLFSMLFLIIGGENGLKDLSALRNQRDGILEKKARIQKENIRLYREIDRLKNDPAYIESVARKELGMIGKNEVILKTRDAGK